MLALILSSLLATAPINLTELPEPYSKLETVLPYNPQGWYSNKRRLEEIAKERKLRTVVEVGSWLGASTRHIAGLLPKDGVVYAVDHWLGSEEHRGDGALDTLYEQFLSNVIHAELTNKIIPVRMDSLEAAKHLQGKAIDLVYIDGAHDKESVLKDLEAWYPYVKGHGVLCGDDWTWPSVREAVEEFAAKENLKIVSKKAFWRLQEPKKKK